MEEWTERVWNRLCLIVIDHTGQVSPALVPSDFDQSSSHHNAKQQPPIAPHSDLYHAMLREFLVINAKYLLTHGVGVYLGNLSIDKKGTENIARKVVSNN